MSYSIYQKLGVIFHLSGTRCHIPFIRNSVSYSIHQKHGVIFHLSGTRCHIPFIRNSVSYSTYQELGVIFHLSETRRHIPFIRNTASYSSIPYMRHSASYPWYRQHDAMTHKTVSSPCPVVCSLLLFAPTFATLTVPGNELQNDLLIEEFSATERLSVLVTNLGMQTDRQTAWNELDLSSVAPSNSTVRWRPTGL